MFEVKNLSAEWKNKSGNIKVFSDVSFVLPEHSLTALCGVNGSGKSTLLSVMTGLLPQSLFVNGEVLLNQKNLINQNVRERAKQISFLVQNEFNAWDITARKLVENGRFVYQKWYENQSAEDEKIVDEAIEILGLKELQNRQISCLSGGELQRFRIARSLAQQTPYIFLDEPLAGLDLNYQKDLIQLLQNLCKQGKTICLSIHDLNLAAQCSDNMILMKKDRSGTFQGNANQMLDSEILKLAFGCDFEVYNHPVTGAKQIW